MRLTSKMATNRLANSEKCEAFFPFNEGSGTTFTDLIKGAVFTDASATFDTPHAASLLSTDLTGIDDGWLKIPANSIFVYAVGYQTLTAGAFTRVTLGAPTSSRVQFGADKYTIEDDAGVELISGTITAAIDGQNSFSLAVVDMASGNMYVHEAINGAAAVLSETITSGVPSGSITVPGEGAISSSLRPHYYGAVLWVLDSVPSEADRNAALDYMADEWGNGISVLPPQFA